MTNLGSDLTALRGVLAGDVITPDSPGYDQARQPALGGFDPHPLAVVCCETPADVAETLAFARGFGVHVTPRGGGHCFAGRSSTTGLVLDVTRMNNMSTSDGLVTVGAGTRLADLYDALAVHDLTLPLGCGPTVGIAGLTLGGGLGILGRAHGLTCDRLRAARIVLADGRIIDCDEHTHADLFWALRGAGGGHFGVVTSLVFEPVPAPPATMFHLTWPMPDAAALIDAWQHWAPHAPDEINVSLRLAGDPPVIHLFGAALAPESDTLTLLDALITRAGRDPASATHRHLPYRAAKQSLVGLGSDDPEPETPPVLLHRSELFRRPLPTDTISALLHHFLNAPTPTRELNLTPLGGAYYRIPAHATAFVHRAELFLLEHVLTLTPDADRTAATDWITHSRSLAHPWSSGRVYPNFPDPTLPNWPEAYYGPNHPRLTRVKHTYDPHNLFHFPQSL